MPSPTKQQYTEFQAAVQYLIDRGAHLIPINGCYHIDYSKRQPSVYENAKRPKMSWKKEPIDKQRAMAQTNYLYYNNWIGLIPASVGLVCLDMDDGNPKELDELLIEHEIDWRSIRTRRGWHYIMRASADWPKGNWNWQHKTCSGEIRFDNGYILMWHPNQLVEFLKQDNPRPVGAVLEKVIRKKRKSRAKTKTKPPAKQNPMEFGPYPPGARDEALFKDLSKLVNQKKDTDAAIDSILRAWLDAPDPKGQGLAARKAIFDEKLLRLRAERAELGEFHFDRKNEEALRQGLAKLNIAFLYNERANRFDWRIDNLPPTSEDDSLDNWILAQLADKFTYQRGNGQHPLRFSINQFNQFMGALCYPPARRYDPFIRWLENLPEWDKTPRLSGFLCRHFEAEHHELSYWGSRYPFIAAIQRAYAPGCQLDEIPVFIGKQGFGKTAFVRNLLPPLLAKEWYSSSFDFNAPNKERIEATMGAVIVEIPEMAGIGRELQKQKGYLSSTFDKARLAYDRRPSNIPRRFIFIGTADRKEVLPNDPAGNRRFVAIEFSKGCHIEAVLDEQRTQLWAEALHYYRAHERANLPRDLMKQQLARNEAYRRADDEYENLVADLDEGKFYSLNDLMELWSMSFPNNRVKNRIANAMQNGGFERTLNKQRRRGWIKTQKLL